jgi:hypothetical protein
MKNRTKNSTKKNKIFYSLRAGMATLSPTEYLSHPQWHGNSPNEFSIKCFYPHLKTHLYLMITIFSRTFLLSKQLILSKKQSRHSMGNIYNDRQQTRKITILRLRRKENPWRICKPNENNALRAMRKISKYNDRQQTKKITILGLRRKKNS